MDRHQPVGSGRLLEAGALDRHMVGRDEGGHLGVEAQALREIGAPCFPEQMPASRIAVAAHGKHQAIARRVIQHAGHYREAVLVEVSIRHARCPMA